MTSEEIKENVSMKDVLDMYGLRTGRNGYIRCPFHTGDNTPSMKIYPKDYHCFACGAHGDVFSFVMLMDGVDFQDAFKTLGGEYPQAKDDKAYKVRLFRARKSRETRQNMENMKARKKKEILDEIDCFRDILRYAEPFSDWWCDAVNKLQLVLLRYEADNGLTPPKGDGYV